MNKELRIILGSFIPSILFISILWLVFIFQTEKSVDLHSYGVFPRETGGLIGILTMPFIHEDIKHIFSNTIPLVILGSCLTFFYRELAFKTFIGIWLLDGIWLWIGGRPAWHIGASGIVYGLASFLLLSGLLRKERRLMAVSLLVVFLYGGMLWGLFPLFFGVSWEAHLFGALAGFLLAFAYKDQGPQRIPYYWEEEDDDDVSAPDYSGTEEPMTGKENESDFKAPPADPIFRINYDYKESDETKNKE
jgi:membrane associated rhomboid family serine protease